MPCNSVIAEPQSGENVFLGESGALEVHGYALPCGDQGPVMKVEVSVDGGDSWTDAEISEQSKAGSKWSWVLWKALVRLPKGEARRVLSRAIDRGGNTQDRNPQWNLRGVAYNCYGEARDLIVC